MFTSVRAPRLSDAIVAQIESAACDGQLKPGDKLPAERELAAQFRVSRTCVREAIRALELRGLVEVRRGVKGGQFIRSADSRTLAAGLAMLFRSHRVDPAELAEARAMIEPETARLAALRATAAELRQLATLLEERLRLTAQGPDAHDLDLTFHRLVAQATHNSVQVLVANTLMDLEANRFRVGLRLGADEAVRVGAAHRRILSALTARDGHGAASRMRAHLMEIQRALARAAGDGPGLPKIVPGVAVTSAHGPGAA